MPKFKDEIPKMNRMVLVILSTGQKLEATTVKHGPITDLLSMPHWKTPGGYYQCDDDDVWCYPEKQEEPKKKVFCVVIENRHTDVQIVVFDSQKKAAAFTGQKVAMSISIRELTLNEEPE